MSRAYPRRSLFERLTHTEEGLGLLEARPPASEYEMAGSGVLGSTDTEVWPPCAAPSRECELTAFWKTSCQSYTNWQHCGPHRHGRREEGRRMRVGAPVLAAFIDELQTMPVHMSSHALGPSAVTPGRTNNVGSLFL